MWKLAASDVKSVSLSFPTCPLGGPLHGSLQSPELRRAGEQAVVQACGAVHPTRGTVTERFWACCGPLRPGDVLPGAGVCCSPAGTALQRDRCRRSRAVLSCSPLHASHQGASWCPRGSPPRFARHCMIPCRTCYQRNLHDCLRDKGH